MLNGLTVRRPDDLDGLSNRDCSVWPNPSPYDASGCTIFLHDELSQFDLEVEERTTNGLDDLDEPLGAPNLDSLKSLVIPIAGAYDFIDSGEVS
jgi:hypothetical protein